MSSPPVGNTYEKRSYEPGDTSAYVKFLVGATGAVSTISRQDPIFGTPVRLAAGIYKFPTVCALDGTGILPGTTVSPTLEANVAVHGTYSTTDGTLAFLVANTLSGGNARSITHGADSVVAATHTFTFANGAFTFDDVGALLTVSGTANGNDKVYTIKSVTSGTVVVTVEAPAADETFGSGVKQAISDTYLTFQINQVGTPGAADPKQGNYVMLATNLKTSR
jgi:hypothetical protein